MIVIYHDGRKEKYTLSKRKKQVTGVEEVGLQSNCRPTDIDDDK